jgi:hypothetical protein
LPIAGDFYGGDNVSTWLANKLGYMTGAVIYFCTYFIFIAMLLLVFALTIFIGVPWVMPKLVRILINLFLTLKNYVLIRLYRMFSRAHTSAVEKSFRNGCKESIYLRVTLICGRIISGRPTENDEHKSVGELEKKMQVLSKNYKASATTSLKSFFKSINVTKLHFEKAKKGLLDIKEILGLR